MSSTKSHALQGLNVFQTWLLTILCEFQQLRACIITCVALQKQSEGEVARLSRSPSMKDFAVLPAEPRPAAWILPASPLRAYVLGR